MTTWAPISGTFPHFGMSTLPYCSSTYPTQYCLKLLDGLIPLWDSPLDGYVAKKSLYRLSKVALRTIFIPMRAALHRKLLSELTYGIVYRRLWKSRLLFFFCLSGTPT